MTHVVSLRYGTDGAPHGKGVYLNLNHQGEAFVWKFPHASKKTPGHGVQDIQDGEQRVLKVHCSIPVDAKRSEPGEPGDRVNPEAGCLRKA